MKKQKFDVRIKGHSVRSLTGKSYTTIRSEGWGSFVRKGSLFLSRYTRIAKYLSGRASMHVSPVRIAAWYAKSRRKVTIVIPSYNDYKYLKKCLESLKKTTNARKVSVIVVDDYCQEANRKRLAKLEKGNVKVIYREKNGGFAKAVNTGLKAVKTGDVVILNSDIVAKKGWLAALQYAAYRFDHNVGIVGPKLLYPNGSIQYGGSQRNMGAPEWFDHYYRFKPSNFGPANVPQHVIGVTGACMYVKRSVIKKIGYLDERFKMAFEDMDYSLRAWKAGFRCLYFPVSTLVHHESVSRGRVQTKREIDSLNYFWKKWGKWFDGRNVRNEKGQVRIIYTLLTTGVSGGIRIVYEHLNRLAERGFDVELYSLDKNPTWMELKVPHRSFKKWDDMIKALSKQEAIKVATWWETAQAVWLGSVGKGIPVFFVQDIETSYYPTDPVMQQTVLSFYRKEFEYLTTSKYNQEQIASQLGHEATAVPCGIDLNMFKPLKNVKREDDVLLALGRGEPLKNFNLTLSGWRKMKNQCRLWLFGVEPHLVRDKKMTYFYKPSDAEVNKLYNQATVFTQTSRHEGFCLPALEAMAAGATVVTTDSHGNRDYCVDGRNCLMIGDKAEEMTDALEKLFSDKALQKRLQTNGYATAKKYDWPGVIDELENFFQDVVKRGAKRAKSYTSSKKSEKERVMA